MDRKTVHWFDERGTHCSGEQLAKITVSIEFTEGQDDVNSHSWDTLFQHGYREIAVDVNDSNINGVPMVCVTGGKLIQEDWLCESRDDAFRQFCERVAKANGITGEDA